MKTLLLFVLAFPSLAIAADITAPQLTLGGRVLDADGQPVVDANVIIVAPSRDGYYQSLHIDTTDDAEKSRSTRSIKTDHDGSYRFLIDTSDDVWHQPGPGTLIAKDPNGNIAAVPYKLTRALIDLPLDIRFTEPGASTIKVLDASGDVISGVTVSPAIIGTASIPFLISKDFASATDEDGMVRLACSPERLNKVFVVGDTVGTQTHGVQFDEHGFGTVTLYPTRKINIRVQHVNPKNTQPIPDIRWYFVGIHDTAKMSDFVWRTFETPGDNAVTIDHVGLGYTNAIVEVSDGHGYFASRDDVTITLDQTELVLSIKRGIHITGRVQSVVDGKPLARIFIDATTRGPRSMITAEDGTYETWISELGDSVYPYAPLGTFFNQDDFFRSPNPQHAPGEASIGTFELTPVAANVGRVVDESGNRVPGVSVQSGNQRFLTDKNGDFRFFEVAAGTPVTLSVHDIRGVTKEPLTVTLTDDVQPSLTLSPASPIRFTATVVDESGTPIAGASVSVLQGVISKPADFMATDYTEREASEGDNLATPIRTDRDGRFESNDVVDWQHAYALKITGITNYERQTSYRLVNATNVSDGRFDFGVIAVRRRAEMRPIVVRVSDETGQSLADARVIVLQPLRATDTATTDAAGLASLSIADAPGVIAVMDRRVGTAFQTIEGNESELSVVIDSSSQSEPVTWAVADLPTRVAAARRVLDTFGMEKSLDITTVTGGEISRLASALAFVDPQAFLRKAMETKSVIEKLDGVGRDIASKVLKRNETFAMMLLPMFPPNERSWELRAMASKANDPNHADALVAQSLAAARETTGGELSMNIGAIAMRMLARGDSKSATELVRQVYESQPEHDASLESEDPNVTRDNRGLARYFYPQVALLDLDKALKLIHRDAYPKEIETLQSLAVLIAVAGGKVDWTTAMGKLGQETFAGSEKSLVPGVFGGTPLPSLAFVKGFADRLPDLTSRGVMLVSAALDLPNATDDERRELLAQAADLMWRSSDRIHGGYYEQLAASLGNRIYRVARIEPALARRFVFECVWDLRGVKDRRAGYPGEAFSPVAEMLAGINAKLSRTVLEPFFVDFNWLMRDHNELYQVTPLVSAARLDPSWAADIAIRLNASEFADDRPRRTLVLDAVLVGLAESR